MRSLQQRYKARYIIPKENVGQGAAVCIEGKFVPICYTHTPIEH